MFLITERSFSKGWGLPLAIADNKDEVYAFCKSEYLKTFKDHNLNIEIITQIADEQPVGEYIKIIIRGEDRIPEKTLGFKSSLCQCAYDVFKVSRARENICSKVIIDEFFN